jgi:hypothetical protein
MNNKKTIGAMMLVGWLVATTQVFGGYTAWRNYTNWGFVGGPLIKIYVRTYYSKNYAARVQWRIENRTNGTLYNFSIGERTYWLANGGNTKFGSEGLYKIKHGETRRFGSDYLNKPDGTKVIAVELSCIYFALEKGGTADRVNIGVMMRL